MSLDQGVKMVPAKWGGLVCGHVKDVTFSNHLKVIADTKVGWILCWEVKLNQCVLRSLFDIALADLGGGAPGARPPYGSRFFRFDMQNFWNVATSGVHGPPYEVHAPPYGKSWIRHCIVLWLSSSYKHGDNILNIGMRSKLVLWSITS